MNGTFRQSAFTSLFNPTNSTPPFFQVFDPAFLETIKLLADGCGVNVLGVGGKPLTTGRLLPLVQVYRDSRAGGAPQS